MRGALLAVALVLVVASALPAFAVPPASTARTSTIRTRLVERLLKASRLVGHPWQGRLVRGVKLRQSEHVRYAGEYLRSENFYGTWELVQLIERSAARVAQRVPGASLYVGELSSPSGGDIDGHGSHESGRDADIAFYMTDGAGRSFQPYGFAEFGADGRGLGRNGSLRFDDVRNWELIARLVADPHARVQYIFVARVLRDRLLRTGAARNAPAAVLERAAALLVQPARGNPHRSHFHVRLYCDPSDRPGCYDTTPFWPWYPGPLPEGAALLPGTGAARNSLRDDRALTE